MRIIKFRAWDGERFTYWGFEENRFVGPSSTGNGGPFNMVHQQFTGLTDKNGKHIYDGDICAVGEKKSLTQCCYDKFGIPCLVGIAYPESHDFCDMEGHNIFANKDIEVVGNIHETPELLNAKP